MADQPKIPPKPAASPLKSASPSSRVTLSKGGAKVGGHAMAQLKAKKEGDALAHFPVEDRVFAIEGLKDLQPPKLFSDYLEKIAPKVTLPPTSHAILEAFGNIDVTAERVGQILRANPYYEYIFNKFILSLTKREEMPSLEGVIILYGMQNVRNLIVALQAARSVLGTHPEWTKEDKLKLVPTDVLKYALKTEELQIAKKDSYSDTAYAAGLLFDVFVMIANELAEDKKKAVAYIETAYGHGLRAAQVAAEIGKLLPDFGFKKYLFGASLIHDIGKVAMVILNPAYLEFVEECRKREWPRVIRQFVETKKFGVDHATLGGAICSEFNIFRPIERAISCHHTPYLLRTKKDLFQLASLICMSTNIANNFKKTDKLDDPIVALWRTAELKDFKVDMKGVLNAVATGVQI